MMELNTQAKEPVYAMEDGQYAFYLDDARQFATERVALLFDADTGTLYQHGAPEQVAAELTRMADTYRNAGYGEMAETLMLIAGPFGVEDLNRCLHTAGYAKVLFEALQANAAQSLH